ncbi:MAG: lamin tail domain-containing protein, partial [Chloroflexota bacterium]|nr:lamin tail domain-containing protein [Chloroflexota bacterium]
MPRLPADRWMYPVVLLAISGLLIGGPPGTPPPPRAAPDVRPVAADADAVVDWPPSSGLLVSEVVTGGVSASDEFVEIYNAGSQPLNLADLELVYATATGGTVTRKQSWADLLLEPRHHLLLANASGVHAEQADGLYSGGFAATGGSVVLRVIGGVVIDSLSWGNASSSFVEGAPGPAPAAGSSLERRPGGELG